MSSFVAKVVALVVLFAARSAWAAFHLMSVTEVFPGTSAAPNAQYIELQMWSGGQNLVSGHPVQIFDANGTMIASATFAGNVASGTNQATILIATTEAVTLFGVTPDLTIAAALPLAGGKVCFDTVDCVAWGSYAGASTGVGTPAFQALGLVRGRSLVRRLDVAGSATVLDGGDDTGNSSNDFILGAPTPRTNGGQTGTPPGSTCGNGTMEGLEGCDDNNTIANDGCSDLCFTEACGDGVVQSNEECDDTNTNASDACSNTCVIQAPATDGAPDASPQNDAGNPATGDGGGCCQSSAPGSSWLGMLVLGWLLRRRRTAVTTVTSGV